MTRAATTLADPCTGAQRRDVLLGLHRGQLVGAQVPSWCSWHGWTLVAPNELARLASLQLVATRHLEGTGQTAPRLRQPRMVRNPVGGLQPEELPERKRIRAPPFDPALAVDPLEIPHHVHAEVPARRH